MKGLEVKELKQVVIRFSGDSGDGMQLAGTIFSLVSATAGNSISTLQDYPADIRAPQGSLTGVSGYQVKIGDEEVHTPGDKCDVLVAMNAAALKTQIQYASPTATIIINIDSFKEEDLRKAEFKTNNYLKELGIKADHVVACPITTMVKACLKGEDIAPKTVLKCRNMFALGIVCWLFNRSRKRVVDYIAHKFKDKPQLADCNIRVLHAGYDYGHNTHASVPATYRIESIHKEPTCRSFSAVIPLLPPQISSLSCLNTSHLASLPCNVKTNWQPAHRLSELLLPAHLLLLRPPDQASVSSRRL